MKCIWHLISYSRMQFAFWASIYNRMKGGRGTLAIEADLNWAEEYISIFKRTLKTIFCLEIHKLTHT